MNYQEILEYSEECKAKYNSCLSIIRKKEDQITLLKEKLEKLKEKTYKRAEKIPHSFTTTILTPIAKELIKLNNNTISQFKIMGCFGLNCEASIWFFKKYSKKSIENIVCSLTFIPYTNKDGVRAVQVWTGEITNQYPVGSIGYYNNMNYVYTEVTSISQLNSLIQKSIEEHKQRGKTNHV